MNTVKNMKRDWLGCLDFAEIVSLNEMACKAGGRIPVYLRMGQR
jgi:hypothetical protein